MRSPNATLCGERHVVFHEVSIDPDACLTTMVSDRYRELYSDFDDVFDTKPSLYNGAAERSKPSLIWAPHCPHNEREDSLSTTEVP